MDVATHVEGLQLHIFYAVLNFQIRLALGNWLDFPGSYRQHSLLLEKF